MTRRTIGLLVTLAFLFVPLPASSPPSANNATATPQLMSSNKTPGLRR